MAPLPALWGEFHSFPGDPKVQHLNLTRTLKDKHCLYPHVQARTLGLREVKPVGHGQRISGRCGTGVRDGMSRWPHACHGSRLHMASQGAGLLQL